MAGFPDCHVKIASEFFHIYASVLNSSWLGLLQGCFYNLTQTVKQT